MLKTSEKTPNSEKKLETFSKPMQNRLNLLSLKVESNNYLMLLSVHNTQKITSSKVL